MTDHEDPVEIFLNNYNDIYTIFPNINNNNYRLTNISLFSSANISQSQYTIEILQSYFNTNQLKNMTISDLSSCIGGNTWTFSQIFKFVYANEISSLHNDILIHNMNSLKLYNINYSQQNAIDVLPKIKADIVFIDPPWIPNIGYTKDDVFYDIYSLLKVPNILSKHMIILKLPKYFIFDSNSIIEFFSSIVIYPFVDKYNNLVYNTIVLSKTSPINFFNQKYINRVNYKNIKFKKKS